MSTTPINPTGITTEPATSQTANPSTTSLANQNVFLQLLVAQLQYQDPTSPADGTQFVTQLAQFSDLSNTTQMASDLDSIKQTLAAMSAATTPASASASTSSPSSTNS